VVPNIKTECYAYCGQESISHTKHNGIDRDVYVATSICGVNVIKRTTGCRARSCKKKHYLASGNSVKYIKLLLGASLQRRNNDTFLIWKLKLIYCIS